MEGARPEFPPDVPAALADLGRRCFALYPPARPTFQQLHTELAALRDA